MKFIVSDILLVDSIISLSQTLTLKVEGISFRPGVLNSSTHWAKMKNLDKVAGQP